MKESGEDQGDATDCAQCRYHRYHRYQFVHSSTEQQQSHVTVCHNRSQWVHVTLVSWPHLSLPCHYTYRLSVTPVVCLLHLSSHNYTCRVVITPTISLLHLPCGFYTDHTVF